MNENHNLSEKQKKMLMAVRQGLLLIVDALEAFVGVEYRTSTLRKELRKAKHEELRRLK